MLISIKDCLLMRTMMNMVMLKGAAHEMKPKQQQVMKKRLVKLMMHL